MFFPYHIQWGSRPSDKGRGGGGGGKGHPDPEIRRGRSCLIRIRIRVWFKNRGDGPLGPPLDLPLIYSRLAITRTFKGNRKKVRVIGSSKKIAESKVKNSFYCTVNILITFNCRNVK